MTQTPVVTEWYDRSGFHRVRKPGTRPAPLVTFTRGDVVRRNVGGNLPDLLVVRVEADRVWCVLRGTRDLSPTSEYAIPQHPSTLTRTGETVDMGDHPAEPEPAPSIVHGRRGYERDRCRCDVCRAANTEHVRKVRARRKARLAASPVPDSDDGHGTQGGYDAGCRCEACRLVRQMRYWREEQGPRRHVWREHVTQTYRDWRDSWELLREDVTIGYLYHRTRASRERSAHKHPRYTDEYVDFLADHPAPTLRAVLVGMAGAVSSFA